MLLRGVQFIISDRVVPKVYSCFKPILTRELKYNVSKVNRKTTCKLNFKIINSYELKRIIAEREISVPGSLCSVLLLGSSAIISESKKITANDKKIHR